MRREVPGFRHHEVDIRDREAILRFFAEVVDELIERRRALVTAGGEAPHDLLTLLLKAQDPETGRGTLGKNPTAAVHVSLDYFLDKPQNIFMGSGGLAMAIGDFGGDLGEVHGAIA